MAELAVVRQQLAEGKLGPVARLMPTTAATTLRGRPRAPGDRRPLRRDQGAAARLLRRRLRDARGGDRGARPPAGAARSQGRGRATRSARSPSFTRGSGRDRLAWIDAALTRRAAPGARRAAALFPRPRSRPRRPSRKPASAPEDLAAERAAARPRRLADPGRPQRRARRRAPAAASEQTAARRGRASPTWTTPRRHLAERLDSSHYRDDILRLLFICCHPDLPATQQIALALRIVSACRSSEIARAFLVGESAMEQRITAPRRRIAAAGVPFETPGAVERASGSRPSRP